MHFVGMDAFSSSKDCQFETVSAGRPKLMAQTCLLFSLVHKNQFSFTEYFHSVIAAFYCTHLDLTKI